MPVYWFALSQADTIDTSNAILIFIILHLLVYPASNGYNSYMDQDEGSIGGIESPLPVKKELFYVTVLLDIIAVILSSFINLQIGVAVILYITASRLYSYRRVRLKKHPFIGYLTVVICQGALVYYIVSLSLNESQTFDKIWLPATISSLLIAGTYPLTQIYQHEQDLQDNVKTISYVLGIKATFVFCAIILLAAVLLLIIHFVNSGQVQAVMVYLVCMLPVLVYFTRWFLKVDKDIRQANFKNLMTMNYVASVCSNIAFIAVWLLKNYE